MNQTLKKKLIETAKDLYAEEDPSHNFTHIKRVLSNAEKIAETELTADMDIIIPAVLFHDAVIYAKNDPRNIFATDKSADKAEAVLKTIEDYPKEKINAVKECILRTSFSKGLKAETIEQQILQDADMLDATGAISIMRTFSSGGKMNRNLYNPYDPFCKTRLPEDLRYSLDLFYTRLLKIKDRMNTKKGIEIAANRTKFQHEFIKELKAEIE